MNDPVHLLKSKLIIEFSNQMFRQKSSQVGDEGAGRHGPLQPHLEGGARRRVKVLAVPEMGPLLAVRLPVKVDIAVSPLELRQRFQFSDLPHNLAFYGNLTDESQPELIGSLKLVNVWVFVQLSFGPLWPMNQLSINPNIA